ncbi:hypothetical protein LCGC14_3050310 [marine sediment metagenome]|uniref:Uncharacterized protein n=1 Tax=marine sediment metagenome TaxID=412755 RepID=A0A0F8WMG4_9ZZZZ
MKKIIEELQPIFEEKIICFKNKPIKFKGYNDYLDVLEYLWGIPKAIILGCKPDNE